MQHPDEGIIHSWLDDALTPEEASTLEAHIATCAECAASVAEARGMRAAATRILSALDDVPAGVIPSPDYFADVRAARDRTVAQRRAGRPFWRQPAVRAAAGLFAVGALAWAVVRSASPARDASNLAGVRIDSGADVIASRPDTPATTAPADLTTAATSAPARDGARSEVEKVASVSQGVGKVAEPEGAARASRRPAPSSAPEFRTDSRDEVQADVRRESATALLAPPPAVAAAAPVAPRRVDSMLADRAAGSATLGANITTERVTQDIAEPRTPRIVIERAYVDSVLAADSMATAIGQPVSGRAFGGASRAAAPQLGRASERSRPSGSPTVMRAQGCWLLETSAWSPRLRGRDTLMLLPRRVELQLDRGIVGEESGERLVRPAPGDPAMSPGVTGYWRVIASDQVRFTLTDRNRWTTVTATVSDDSLAGTARAYTDSDRLLRSATVSARRVVCRTER